MKTILFALILMLWQVNQYCYSQLCSLPSVEEYAPSIDAYEGATPAGYTCATGVYDSLPTWWEEAPSNSLLYYDIFIPKGSWPSEKRPLLILLDGQGFVDVKRKAPWIINTVDVLKDDKFIIVSIDYRTGWGKICDLEQGTPENQRKAVYRSVQDARKALWYFYVHAQAGEIQIDTDAIFIGGISAGAITSIQAAFMEQEEMDEYLAYYGEQTSTTQDLGLLDPYIALNCPAPKIKGLINLWGAIPDPKYLNNVGQFAHNNTIPILQFQGSNDHVVPFLADYGFKNKGCGCSPENPTSDYAFLFGARYIHTRINKLGKAVQTHVIREAGHGLFLGKGSGRECFEAEGENYIYLQMQSFMHSVIDGQNPRGYFRYNTAITECLDTVAVEPCVIPPHLYGGKYKIEQQLDDQYVEAPVLSISPNPLEHEFMIRSEYTISNVGIFDFFGRTMPFTISRIDEKNLHIGLPTYVVPGFYLVRMETDFGLVTRVLAVK